jgi:hypothetical protein
MQSIAQFLQKTSILISQTPFYEVNFSHLPYDFRNVGIFYLNKKVF